MEYEGKKKKTWIRRGRDTTTNHPAFLENVAGHRQNVLSYLIAIEEEENGGNWRKTNSKLEKKEGRRRLDSDFVHLDRRRKRQVFVAEQLQSRPPSAAVMHASSKSSSLGEARLVA